MSSPKRVRYSSNDEASQDIQDSSDPGLQSSLEQVESCQIELESLADQENKDVVHIIQKYEVDKQPIYMKRADVINRIPNFWITALLNHPAIKIHESEEDCLSNLTFITVQNCDPLEQGYDITFHFRPNPYFINIYITKEYRYKTILYDGSAPITNISHTPINWKVGEEVVKRLKEQKSFFWWLCCYDDGPMDLEMAEIIKDDLWVNPLQYYLISDNANSDDDEDSEDVLIIEDEEDDKKVGWLCEEDLDIPSSPETPMCEEEQ